MRAAIAPRPASMLPAKIVPAPELGADEPVEPGVTLAIGLPVPEAELKEAEAEAVTLVTAVVWDVFSEAGTVIFFDG